MATARQLTAAERQAFIVRVHLTDDEIRAVPAHGEIIRDTVLGPVLVFVGLGNGRLYLLVVDEGLAQQVERAPYTSPDAGLMATINDMIARTERMGVTVLNLSLVFLVLWGLSTLSKARA